jgi:hypothetical protein
MQGKPRRFLVCLCPGLADLAEFGFGLDRAWLNFNVRSMEMVHANSRAAGAGQAMTLKTRPAAALTLRTDPNQQLTL